MRAFCVLTTSSYWGTRGLCARPGCTVGSGRWGSPPFGAPLPGRWRRWAGALSDNPCPCDLVSSTDSRPAGAAASPDTHPPCACRPSGTLCRGCCSRWSCPTCPRRNPPPRRGAPVLQSEEYSQGSVKYPENTRSLQKGSKHQKTLHFSHRNQIYPIFLCFYVEIFNL